MQQPINWTPLASNDEIRSALNVPLTGNVAGLEETVRSMDQLIVAHFGDHPATGNDLRLDVLLALTVNRMQYRAQLSVQSQRGKISFVDMTNEQWKILSRLGLIPMFTEPADSG